MHILQPILWKVFEVVFDLLGNLKLNLKEIEKNANAYHFLITKARYKVFDALIICMCAEKVEVMNGFCLFVYFICLTNQIHICRVPQVTNET